MLHLELLEDFERDSSRLEVVEEEFNKMSMEELQIYGNELAKDIDEWEKIGNELKLKEGAIIRVYERKRRERELEGRKNEIGGALEG